MKKINVKQAPVAANYGDQNSGTVNNRAVKVAAHPAPDSGMLDREFEYDYDPNVGVGTSRTRTKTIKPSGKDLPKGVATPLRASNKAAKDATDSIGKQVSVAKPIRKRS